MPSDYGADPKPDDRADDLGELEREYSRQVGVLEQANRREELLEELRSRRGGGPRQPAQPPQRPAQERRSPAELLREIEEYEQTKDRLRKRLTPEVPDQATPAPAPSENSVARLEAELQKLEAAVDGRDAGGGGGRELSPDVAAAVIQADDVDAEQKARLLHGDDPEIRKEELKTRRWEMWIQTLGDSAGELAELALDKIDAEGEGDLAYQLGRFVGGLTGRGNGRRADGEGHHPGDREDERAAELEDDDTQGEPEPVLSDRARQEFDAAEAMVGHAEDSEEGQADG